MGVLQVAKSKTLKKWKELVSEVFLCILWWGCNDFQNQFVQGLCILFVQWNPFKVTLGINISESFKSEDVLYLDSSSGMCTLEREPFAGCCLKKGIAFTLRMVYFW